MKIISIPYVILFVLLAFSLIAQNFGLTLFIVFFAVFCVFYRQEAAKSRERKRNHDVKIAFTSDDADCPDYYDNYKVGIPATETPVGEAIQLKDVDVKCVMLEQQTKTEIPEGDAIRLKDVNIESIKTGISNIVEAPTGKAIQLNSVDVQSIKAEKLITEIPEKAHALLCPEIPQKSQTLNNVNDQKIEEENQNTETVLLENQINNPEAFIVGEGKENYTNINIDFKSYQSPQSTTEKT